MKNKMIFIGVGIFFLVILGLTIYFIVFQTIFPTWQGTEYSSYAVSSDGKTLTYSGLWKYEDFMGLTEVHYLSDEIGGKYFPSGVDNKGYFPFYLELNNIDSSQFSAGGIKPLVCAFSPENGNPYSAELSALGFEYLNTNDYKEEYGSGDGGVCCNFEGCCNECATIGCSGTVNRCCEQFKRIVVIEKTPCWTGNYKLSNLRANADKLTCFVNSGGYTINGKVSVINTGFYCTIDNTGLNYIASSFGSSSPTVSFRLAESITIYRFENNRCTHIILLENERLSNDYDTSAECEENIIQCSDQPNSPCEGAVWTDYPTCAWDTSDCEASQKPNYILWIAISVLVIFLISIIILIITKIRK